jgi:hypothetical protein
MLPRYPANFRPKKLFIDPLLHSESIARDFYNKVSELFNDNRAVLAEALVCTLKSMADFHEVEFNRVQNIAAAIQEVDHPESDRLDRLLQYYLGLFEGPYRAGLALRNVLWRLERGDKPSKEKVEEFLKHDVSQILREFVSDVPVDNQRSLYQVGAEVHIRNAVAHQHIQLNADTITLTDGTWQRNLDWVTLEYHVRNINATYLGMQLGLFLAFIALNQDIRNLVSNISYSLKNVHTVLDIGAKNYGFILNNIFENDRVLHMELLPLNRPKELPKKVLARSGSLVLTEIFLVGSSAVRIATDFVREYQSILNNYVTLILELPILSENDPRWLEVDLKCLRDKSDKGEDVSGCFRTR